VMGEVLKRKGTTPEWLPRSLPDEFPESPRNLQRCRPRPDNRCSKSASSSTGWSRRSGGVSSFPEVSGSQRST
jgi:hypothetical protein